jgi:HEAT repeats
MRRRWRLCVSLALLLAIVGVSLHPAVYWPTYGWLRGEAFYKGMPTSYWEEEAAAYTPIFFDQWQPKHDDGTAAWKSRKVDRYRWILAHMPPQGTPLEPAPCPAIVNDRPPLADGDPDAIPVLLQLLQSRVETVRWLAVWEMVELGSRANDAIPALHELLTSDDAGARHRAATALRAIDPDAAKESGVE